MLGRDATIATAEGIEFIVQIRILQEVRRVATIAWVEKELKNADPGARSSSASVRHPQ